MLVKPDWDVFKAKFHSNPQDYFEWFSYLLFCREFDLEKGWYGFKNQSAIEKSPIIVGSETIGFQSKFYQAKLNDRKTEILDMLAKSHRDYPSLTKIIFYTNQSWSQVYDKSSKKMVDSKAYAEVFELASTLGIDLDWRDTAFFESPFVSLANNDLSGYFFDDNDYKGWKRFGDWSSKSTDIAAEYYIDEDVKIISPNHNNLKSITVVEGLNEIRVKLFQKNSSLRLVGLSGVGKTRFAQALFDKRIGESALDIRNVWYCDLGDSPNPNPQHFIEQMIEENKPTLVIVDNCGQELHSSLTKSIKDSEKISLLTIEYDVNDGLPEETSIYRMQPTTTELLKKVIERHYPELESININKIADFSGGNYRLALAIASNIGKSDNLSILTDDDLFKRLFYQKGELNEEAQNIGQIFSLVFSFNVEDSNETASEINILSELADVTPRKAYRLIEKLHGKDIVQKRGDFRAILPHALANNLAKQAILGVSNSELNLLLTDTPERFQTSFLKRLSYLHDNDKVKSLVKGWLAPEGYFGSKILDEQLTETDLRNISLLTSICPDELLDVLKLRYEKDSNFLSTSNPNSYSLANLLRNLAYFDKSFEKAFWLLFEIVKIDRNNDSKDNSLKELFSSLFHYHLSQTEASFATKKRVIERLSNNEDYYKYILDIIDNGLGSDNRTIFIYSDDNGLVQNYSYELTNGDVWDWFDFLLDKLNDLDNAYPDECRKIFSSNLKRIIWLSGRTDEVIKYLRGFHDRQPFISALLEVKKIIKYNSKELKDVPSILDELQAIEDYLEPENSDIQSLIITYIFSSDSHLFKSSAHYSDELGLSLSGFTNIEELIEFIGKNLSSEIVRENLNEFLTSNNHYVRDIGNSVAIIYPSIDDFISDLQAIPHAEQPLYNRFFLSGLSKVLIETDWISYTKLINYIISVPSFHIIAPRVMAEVSTKKEHFEFIIDKITQYSEVDFSYLGDQLAFQKLHQYITPELFEFVLDEIISLNEDNIVLEALLFDSRQNKVIADKYIDKMLELLPEAMESRNYYDYSHALQFILSYSEDSNQKVFDIVEYLINSQSYLFSLESNSLGDILEALLVSSSSKILNLIYANDQFKHIIMNRGLKELLFKVNEAEVLAWLDNHQNKIDFWFSNSKFCQISDEGEIKWFNLLNELLLKSSEPEANLSNMIDSNIIEVFSYSGSYSGVLSRRLPLLESLKQYLKQHNHDELIPLIEQKKADFQKYIEQAQKEEAKESKEQQGFDW
ncbi:hypothetical protein [Psychrobacter okhotskensis]|uniref:hypothetical protein n=1 Tax=Psychrobacter okhotskensis TaxID=212403 RepID=UPI00191988ED|nr:hypothetical protein [Psychrobacter okhotskensis]